jgi:hypothetical protein
MVESDIKNVRDLGYRFAAFQDGTAAFIAYAKDHIPGFPNKDKIADEVITEFKAGCLIRFTELHPSKHYIVEGEDSFKEVSEPEDVALAGFECSVAYCVGMSKYEFGELLPNKKHIVKLLRDAAKNYGDLRWSRLLKSANEEASEAKTRASNKLFMDWLNGVLADMPKKAKIAVKNGDSTAIEDSKLRVAIEVFKQKLVA